MHVVCILCSNLQKQHRLYIGLNACRVWCTPSSIVVVIGDLGIITSVNNNFF